MTTLSRSVLLGLAAALVVGEAAWAADHQVSQQGRRFHPGEIAIKAGDTVTISNDDEFLHHVYVKGDGMDYDSGGQPIGTSLTIPFPVKGVFEVRCDIHPKMRLTVTVE
ncbi:plastocyanin/azurin family copper-binding protein [Pseudokordiimonas caeni]|uniref:plastocyanin/azurin family copper-binding protein n=1 Tax=Pseudokordiimonas caeni TaxID=2997908 RepID=UPI0028120F62|nr:plastocyanin/azurin family copper-binding protein [Pseudokordiimonas caeni]